MSQKKALLKLSISRRKLLKLFGIGTATLAADRAASQIRITKVLPQTNIQTGQTSPVIVKLLRPQDLLSLELRFYNFSLSGNKLVKTADPGLMMVVFPAQSIAEQCGTEDTSGLQPPPHPAKMLISGDSRLVFKVNKSSLALDVKELLNWESFDLVVNQRAKGADNIIYLTPIAPKKAVDKILIPSAKTSQINNARGLTKDEKLYLKQKIFKADEQRSNTHLLANIGGALTQLVTDPVAPPGDWETSLEIPFRLFLSPTSSAGWNHIIKLNSSKGLLKDSDQLFELWHTRMGVKTSKGIDESDLTFEDRVLRILWGEKINKEYGTIPANTEDQFLGNTSTNDFYRHQMVHESSNFLIKGFVPQPVKTYKLFLTSLGAWLDSIFVVDRSKLIPAASPLSLLKWRHIQTLAREHYVELVLAGNIMPFGHEAVLITITERKPHSPTLTATNFKRQLVVITQPVKDYNYRDGNGMFMNFCFSKVEMITTATPLLDTAKKKLVDPSPMSAEEQFIIRSGGKDIQFKIRGEDLNGNIVNFQMPLVFVSNTVLSNSSNLNDLVETYNKGVFADNNTNFNGQKVSLAPPEANGVDTGFAAYEASFKVMKYSSGDELQGFLPNLIDTKILEPSYKRLTGISAPVSVSLEDDNNSGHVFARFNFSAGVNFAGNADKTGGFAMPNFNLSGLSKAAGAFGGKIDDFKNATANAAGYFSVSSMPDPVLFGVFKLSDILDFAAGDKSSYDLSKPLLNRVPKIPNLTTEETATEIITSYVIKPNLKTWGIPKVVDFKPSSPTGFSIVTQAVIKKSDPAAVPSFSTEAKMEAFTIGIIDDLINVKFQQLKFSASPGKSADINITMKNPALEFGGPLSFINAFQQLIPATGFSDPPYLDVSLTGVKCGYTLAIPSLQLGAFSLSNLSLGAEVNLPFTGAPLTMGFRFCEKQQPFTLTVSLLGGGGYFGFEADLHGLRQIDAALEFGAAVSLNLGVASGAVSIMAGIYFKMVMADGQNSTQLTGYLRINGSMSIIGLITASIELYMALTYLMDKHKAYGEASVSIKVEVLFFSKTVSVHTSRTFAGSGSDPNFQLTYSPDHWKEYCEAYAA